MKEEGIGIQDEDDVIDRQRSFYVFYFYGDVWVGIGVFICMFMVVSKYILKSLHHGSVATYVFTLPDEP